MALGLVLTLLASWAYFSRWSVTETLSLKSYDFTTNTLSRFRPAAKKIDAINIVEIDEDSVTTLGRWPWPRKFVGELLDEVVAKGGKVIGINVIYSDPEESQGLDEIDSLHETYAKLLKSKAGEFKKKKVALADMEEFLEILEESKMNLDGDAHFTRSIEEAGNVILPMYFHPGQELGNNLEKLPAYFEKEKMGLAPNAAAPPTTSATAAILPLEKIGAAALAVGHCNLLPDVDGVIRRIPPVVRYGQFYYPSFGLQLVREYLNLQREALTWNEASGFALKNAHIPADVNANVAIDFSGSEGTFKKYSAVDVLSGALPEKVFDNKIVLIGVTAPGVNQIFVGPSGKNMTDLEVWSNHLENILNQRFISQPPWSTSVEVATLVLGALVLIVVLPLTKARVSIPVAAILFLSIVAASAFLFVKNGFWISPTYGALLILSGFVIMVAKRLLFTEKGKEMVEAESVETNKMLGLSFQGQGMLDLAFEKFRRCPLDDAMKELLYNLGLDMERKRQFTKAAAVFEHIATVDPKYKDIHDKIELLKKAGEGAVFGNVGKKGSEATVVVEGLGQNTTLGRYEIVKELGRGAMGIVYLGKDPKINRQVAIKTLRFEDEISEEQMKSTKSRFFREAESAGSLTHPNIIRIFDAGEDQEVAYIAMELLDGHDLKTHCEKPNLFSLPRVVGIIIQVADALEYAHKQGVVHRDIKPANIMQLKDGTLRITDFGIARIQASSKTATGAVLGTPAYMSPEQVNGGKADGRADIFSLGVMFFEMMTGQKPFQADSIAALLYRIANVEHPNPREYNPAIPPSIIKVLNKALAKDIEKRYQTAGEMANDLRVCQKDLAAAENPIPEKPMAPPPLHVIEPTPAPAPTEKPAEAAAPANGVSDTFTSELQDAFNLPELPKSNDVDVLPEIERTFIPPPPGETQENK